MSEITFATFVFMLYILLFDRYIFFLSNVGIAIIRKNINLFTNVSNYMREPKVSFSALLILYVYSGLLCSATLRKPRTFILCFRIWIIWLFIFSFQLFLGGLSDILHIGACGYLYNRTNVILATHGTFLFFFLLYFSFFF